MKRMRISALLVALFLVQGAASGDSGCRYLWLVRDDLSSAAVIDSMLVLAREAGANGIIAQVVGRAEAYYPSDLLPEADFSEGFDPLGYLVARAAPMGLEVHAWLNAFLVWSAPWNPVSPSHVCNALPEWFMCDINSRSTLGYTRDECDAAGLVGATLSPSEPEVREFIADVAEEIVLLYDVDGIHLDYIRYPNESFGFEDRARMLFFFETGIDPVGFHRMHTTPSLSLRDSWGAWKETQVTSTVRTVRSRLDAAAPGTLLSCAVMADPFDARSQYSCDWRQWLKDGDIDLAFTMAYTTNANRARELAVTGTNLYPDHLIHGIGIYNQPMSRAFSGAREALSRGAAGVCVFSLNSLYPDSAWVLREFWRFYGSAPVEHAPNPALFYRTARRIQR